ncbi:MAG: hypothetical protein NVSMB6_07140 [Burkholderiaceae bacterium]
MRLAGGRGSLEYKDKSGKAARVICTAGLQVDAAVPNCRFGAKPGVVCLVKVGHPCCVMREC